MQTVEKSNTVLTGNLLDRDPVWDTAVHSTPQSSLFVESVNYRTATLFGVIVTKEISGRAKYVDINQEKKTSKLTFSFGGVVLSNVNAIKVRRIVINNLDVGEPGQHARLGPPPASSRSCGDVASDQIVRTRKYYRFSGNGGGSLSVRLNEDNNLVRTIRIFESDGSEDGWYSIEEVLDRLTSRLEAFLVSINPALAAQIGCSYTVNSQGYLELFWYAPFLGQGKTYSIMELNAAHAHPDNFFKIFNRILRIQRVHRTRAYPSIGVSDAQAVEVSLGPRAVDYSTIVAENSVVLFSSKELTKYQTLDSLCNVGSTDLIAVGTLNVSQANGNNFDFNDVYGNLNSAKVQYDALDNTSAFNVEVTMKNDLITEEDVESSFTLQNTELQYSDIKMMLVMDLY